MTRVRVYAQDGESVLTEFEFANDLSDEGLAMIVCYAQRYGCGAYYLETFPVAQGARYP